MRIVSEVLSLTSVTLRWVVLCFVSLFVLGGLAHGQSFDAPGLAPFCNGLQYGVAQQADLAAVPPPYNTLMYAKAFSCNIPVSCALCNVTVGFMENRSDPTLIGPKQRLFTVGLNGGVSDVLDLFVLAGPKVPYIRSWIVPVYNGKLSLVFAASVLNATVSTIAVSPALLQGPAGPQGPQGLTGPIGPTWDAPCGGVALCVFVSREIPLGTVDGANTTFNLLAVPKLGTEFVFLNGVRMTSGVDYTITGETIVFTTPPSTGTNIQVDYQA